MAEQRYYWYWYNYLISSDDLLHPTQEYRWTVVVSLIFRMFHVSY